MGFHGCGTDEERLGDLGVVEAAGDRGQHLAFAGGEPFQTRGDPGVVGEVLSELADAGARGRSGQAVRDSRRVCGSATN